MACDHEIQGVAESKTFSPECFHELDDSCDLDALYNECMYGAERIGETSLIGDLLNHDLSSSYDEVMNSEARLEEQEEEPNFDSLKLEFLPTEEFETYLGDSCVVEVGEVPFFDIEPTWRDHQVVYAPTTEPMTKKEQVAIEIFPTTTEERMVPPDGGFGWAVVATNFLITFLLTGFVKSFGSFRKLVMVEFPETTGVEAGWITALIGTLPLLFSPVTGILMNRFGYRPLVFVGGLLCSGGVAISYFATSGLFLVGSLGACMGIGSSLIMTSAIVCVGRYFTKRRPTAIALSVSGGCFGAMAMPTAFHYVTAALGLHHSLLVVSGAFSMICVCSLAYGNPEQRFVKEMVEVPLPTEPASAVVSEEPKEKHGALVTARKAVSKRLAFRFLGNGIFLLSAASMFVMAVGNHFLGLTIFQAKSLGVEEHAATMLLAYAAIGDLTIRLSYGLLASRSPFPRTLEYVLSLVLSAVCVVAIPFTNAFWQLIVIAVASGVATGMFAILVPLLLSANHGAKNMSRTFTLVRLLQGVAKLMYQPASAGLKSVFGTPAVIFFVGANMTLAAILAILLHVAVNIGNRKR